MTDAISLDADQVLKVGPDRVTMTGHRVMIQAKHEMPGWELREFNRIPIYVGDRKYFLLEKEKKDDSKMVKYVLEPWPIELSTTCRRFLIYDAEAVAEREAELRSGGWDEFARVLLMPLYPLLGMCWSGVQRRFIRFGFIPHALSGASIFATFCLLFAQGVFAIIMVQASLRSGKIMIGGMIRAVAAGDHLHLGPISVPVIWLDGLLVLLLIADLVMRYTEYLREEQWSGGFMEWVVRRKEAADKNG